MPTLVTETKKALELDIQNFINDLPYWAKYLLSKHLEAGSCSEGDIDEATKFFLEDYQLSEPRERTKIDICYSETNLDSYQEELFLEEIREIEGVNALIENETLSFSPQVTIFYGANGSGKTGYIRFLKEAFFSRSKEEIISNVNNSEKKEIEGKFLFKSPQKGSYKISFSQHESHSEFHQYAVFDNKGVDIHLNEFNEFEFRPKGLDLFIDLSNIYKAVESKLNTLIEIKATKKGYSQIFEGESPIKDFLDELSSDSSIEVLKQLLPYGEKSNEETKQIHRQKKKELEQRKAEIVALKKEQEIKDLKKIQLGIKNLIQQAKVLNTHFNKTYINETQNLINNYLEKSKLAEDSGVEYFNNKDILSIGGDDWKEFIKAADKFAKAQDKEYPKVNDPCLLCHQPLGLESQELINRYRKYLKSESEEAVNSTIKLLEDKVKELDALSFNLLPEENIVRIWLLENYPEQLKLILDETSSLNILQQELKKHLEEKEIEPLKAQAISIEVLNSISTSILGKITKLESKDNDDELKNINQKLVLMAHEEKLVQHFNDIEDYISSLTWVHKANDSKRELATKRITDKQKELANYYFNQKFISTFNEECSNLNGNFDIAIKHKGEKGSSFRQLNLKDYSPSKILSEGEQKVISLADFLSEIRHFGMNRGIIFDDPVSSLDEERKATIAKRLVQEAKNRQVILFTHDLVFVSSVIDECQAIDANYLCHWVEKLDSQPGKIWLKNTPSYEKDYKKSGKAQHYYNQALQCEPQDRENKIKNGFAALRTSYESLVIFDLFKGVVQRFRERISIESLKDVSFDSSLKEEIIDSFACCCRYMEGHSHSDKYAYRKPDLNDLKVEIERFNSIRNKIKNNSQ